MKTAIVFIQIGNPIPGYALENIKRTTHVFAREHFLLVVDKKIFATVPEEIKKLLNLTIFVSDLGENLVSSNVSPKDFRQGFWHYTKLRLCTLRELHREFPQFSLLHVENDVLLMPDFLKFSFELIESTSWLSHTEQDDSGAILFTPSPAATDNFVEKFMTEIENEGTNSDMRILNRMRKRFPSDFGLLPTLNSSLLSANEDLSMEHSMDAVSGFDPAFLGIWMFGDDARNRFGLSKKFTFLGRGKYILPELLDFDPNIPSLFFNESKRKTRVLSVHVHSKKTEVFSALWLSEIEKAVLVSRRGRPAWNFSFKVLAEVLNDYKRRGKLHTLPVAIPVIGRVISKLKSNVS